MADVFISYSSKNRDQARMLASALAGLGLSVWWDREIVTGQAFDSVIERELVGARCVVVLWSRESVDSEWVKNEAALAAERGVLLPAGIDGTRPPLEFRRKQTADLSDWSGDSRHEGFQALCRAINGIVGGAALPPKPAPARRMQGQGRPVVVGAVVVMVILAGAGAYFTLSPTTGPAERIETSGQAQGMDRSGPRRPADRNPDLAGAVAGTYVGEIIADSKGGSRANVVVTVSRIGADAVRVSSPNGRVGTMDVELTRVEGKVLNAAGDTPFIVDLDATPPTLTLDPRGELAYRGTRTAEGAGSY